MHVYSNTNINIIVILLLRTNDDCDICSSFRHVSSPAGKESYFKKPLKQMRESTLFAPFLDDGERGHIFFVMLVLETAGLLLAPLTLLLQVDPNPLVLAPDCFANLFPHTLIFPNCSYCSSRRAGRGWPVWAITSLARSSAAATTRMLLLRTKPAAAIS